MATLDHNMLQDFEKICLGILTDAEHKDESPLVNLKNQQFDKFLTSTNNLGLFVGTPSAFNELLSTCTANNEDLFCHAIAYLQIFVQVNWIGPLVKLENLWHDSETDIFYDLMETGGASCYSKALNLDYLYASICILKHLSKASKLVTCDWWLFRCYNVYSQILNERSMICSSHL